MGPAMLGALMAGALIGAIPAITGAVKGKLGLGLGGFVCCVIGSVILGLLLSVPLCAIFMFLIFKKTATGEQDQGNSFNDEALPVFSKNSDIVEQIEKLSELKDAGILTEEEFNVKKAHLLSKIQ